MTLSRPKRGHFLQENALAVGHRVVLSSRGGGHKLAASVAKLGQGAEAAPVTEAVKTCRAAGGAMAQCGSGAFGFA